MSIKNLVNNRLNRRIVERQKKTKRKKHVTYVLMATVLPVHVVTGTIDFPGSIPGRLKRAKEINLACTDNANVAIDPLVNSAIDDNIKDYETATPGDRPGKYTIMNQAIQNNLLAPFQKAADAKPVDSIGILQSGKFNVKDSVVRVKQIFEGVASEKPGVVILKAPGGPEEAHLHNWFSSLDGIIFKQEQSTNAANTTLGGYPSNKLMYFMTQLSVKDVLQKMSGVIKFMTN